MNRYIVKLKGEFEVTQAVVANNEEEARDKAKRSLGETINRTAVGDQQILEVKEMPDREASVTRGSQNP